MAPRGPSPSYRPRSPRWRRRARQRPRSRPKRPVSTLAIKSPQRLRRLLPRVLRPRSCRLAATRARRSLAWPPLRRRCVCRDAPSQKVQPGGEARCWGRRRGVRGAACVARMSVPMQRLVPRSEAAMEAAQGRSQAAACGVSGCASTVECSAYGFMRVRTSVRAAQQHRATKASNDLLKVVKAVCVELDVVQTWPPASPRGGSSRVRLPPGAAVYGSPSSVRVYAPPPRGVGEGSFVHRR